MWNNRTGRISGETSLAVGVPGDMRNDYRASSDLHRRDARPTCSSSVACLPSWRRVIGDTPQWGHALYLTTDLLHLIAKNTERNALVDIREGVIHALRGHSVLFAGAGFTNGATNSRPEPDNQVPDASAFSRHLARSLEITKDYDLPIISQYYVSKRGRTDLLPSSSPHSP